MEIISNNVITMLNDVLWALKSQNVEPEQTRNGPVVAFPDPVILTYCCPQERVLINKDRNANPYFHLFEALWMLDGRNDVTFPSQFNSNMVNYSDDGKVFHGAYGWRWVMHFGKNQIESAIRILRKDPNSRRCVITMWDPRVDMEFEGKDFPCNTHIYLDVRGGELNMTVCNRSNDIIWGALGANAVHMSILQEYIAAHLNVRVGKYRQFSNNMHLYLNFGPGLKLMETLPGEATDPYATLDWSPYPLIDEAETWEFDNFRFLSNPMNSARYTNLFFQDVARPMYMSWFDRKMGKDDGSHYANQILADDWRTACLQWIEVQNAKRD